MATTLSDLKSRYPSAETFRFGDSPALSRALLSLVRSGRKVATCSALHEFQDGEPFPKVGRRDICLNWDGTPALVIETLELIRCRFDEVTEDMALAEGEDDSLEDWRVGHRDYFERNGGVLSGMQLIWGRVALFEDFSQDGLPT
ncbi:ASCH domain-containing protein [Phaeobacter sp. HF9A]|uniref:ASCH domain-containing protein n=1 Tax=Phaeobacter sp. HF9A TaxID=2721561 RepID=UPI00142FC83A|nr:ASCH domain-containing protein [Phaeobacter sp. HF9A]NIZ12491.1 ASCH domain-containing protein [Phaeobacter sp. HF9A]